MYNICTFFLEGFVLSDNGKLAENKLILLFLLQKIDLSLSNNEICQFALERNIMDYFNVQQYLSELTDADFVESFTDNGTTRYRITHEGTEALEFFQNRIPEWMVNAANEYIINNRQRIKNEYETSANYFPEINGEFLVKCAVCGIDGQQIMEVDVVVPTKHQAQIICNNWKKNVSFIYGTIFSALIKDE